MKKKLALIIMMVLLVGCNNDSENNLSLLEEEVDNKNILLEEQLKEIDLLNENLTASENKINELMTELSSIKENIDSLEGKVDAVDFDSNFKEIPVEILETVFVETEKFLNEAQLMYPDCKYVDYRVEDVIFVKAFEDINDMNVFAYRINYKLKSLAPENIIYAGPMYKTENDWVLTTYPDATYLFFDNNNKYQFNMMINDASPESELFKNDLLKKLKSLE